METIQFVKMDVINRTNPAVIEVVQGDSYSRKIALFLYANSVSWAIPSDVRAVINYHSAHEGGGSYDALPDGSSAYSISGNQIVITLSPRIMNTPGRVYLSVTLIEGERELSTFDIVVNVYRKIDGLLTDSDGNYANLNKESAIQLISGLLMGTQTGTPKHWLNVYALADLLVHGSSADVLLHTVNCITTNATCHCGRVVAHGAGLVVEFEIAPGYQCKSVSVKMGDKEIVIDAWDYSLANESDWTECCLSEYPEEFANWVKIYEVVDDVEISVVAELDGV